MAGACWRERDTRAGAWCRGAAFGDDTGSTGSSGHTLDAHAPGHPSPHLLSIVAELKGKGIAFWSLTEQMEIMQHGRLLFTIFKARSRYERGLTRKRVVTGVVAARCRRGGGR